MVFTRREQKTIVIFSFKDDDHSFSFVRDGNQTFSQSHRWFARATRLFVRVSLKNTETNGTEITDREQEITETKEETEEHAGRWLSELHTTRTATDIVTSFIVKYGKWTTYLSTRIMFCLSFHKRYDETKESSSKRNGKIRRTSSAWHLFREFDLYVQTMIWFVKLNITYLKMGHCVLMKYKYLHIF